ncbi:hypothetical protein [Thermococcus sp.]|uniref:hypothetical protein n=1 Tax=Thermococcus sp. TaxID=35749 RepID=UPI002604C24C|nr:hypothetical protein [Thermococcus sp.]
MESLAGLFSSLYGNIGYWKALSDAGKNGLGMLVLPALGAYIGFELARGYGRKVARDVRVEK